MKKIILIVFSITVLISCKNIDDVRKVKVGMTTEELKQVMGEPNRIHINADHEDWYFTYFDRNGLDVYVRDNKVVDFYSY